MKVKELIETLSKFDEDLEICMSRDPEGNNFHTLYQVELMRYDSEHGETYVPETELTDELIELGFGEEDLRPNLDLWVCLWP